MRFTLLFRVPIWTLILSLVVIGIFGKRGILDWRRMLARNAELGVKLEQLAQRKADLEREVAALKSDPAEQERVIRQTLGYVRKDETVIEFP